MTKGMKTGKNTCAPLSEEELAWGKTIAARQHRVALGAVLAMKVASNSTPEHPEQLQQRPTVAAVETTVCSSATSPSPSAPFPTLPRSAKVLRVSPELGVAVYAPASDDSDSELEVVVMPRSIKRERPPSFDQPTRGKRQKVKVQGAATAAAAPLPLSLRPSTSSASFASSSASSSSSQLAAAPVELPEQYRPTSPVQANVHVECPAVLLERTHKGAGDDEPVFSFKDVQFAVRQGLAEQERLAFNEEEQSASRCIIS